MFYSVEHTDMEGMEATGSLSTIESSCFQAHIQNNQAFQGLMRGRGRRVDSGLHPNFHQRNCSFSASFPGLPDQPLFEESVP